MAVMRAWRLIRRARSRSFSINVSSSIFSSPVSMLRVPRAAIAIQVFSRDCIKPKPAIQIGKKMIRRRRRGEPLATSTKAVPTPAVSATIPMSRRFVRSRGPMLIASEGIKDLVNAGSARLLPALSALWRE